MGARAQGVRARRRERDRRRAAHQMVPRRRGRRRIGGGGAHQPRSARRRGWRDDLRHPRAVAGGDACRPARHRAPKPRASSTMLTPTITEEFQRNGFVFLGAAGFGLDVVFSRAPVRSLRSCAADTSGSASTTTCSPDADGDRHADRRAALQRRDAYDEGRIDGFIATPASALAFQWAGLVRAYTDVKMAYLPGCMALSTRAFDKLPFDAAAGGAPRSAALAAGFEDVGRALDHQLLDDIFPRTVSRAWCRRRSSSATRRGAAAARANERKLISPALLTRTVRALAPK